MTYKTCERLIVSKRNKLNTNDWEAFAIDMNDKLDIFLLNHRITDEEYNLLVQMLN